MNRRNPIQTSEELIRAFAELFDELEPNTPEEIASVLRDGGYNPDEIGTRIKAAADQALTESPFNWRSRAQRELEIERERISKRAVTSPASRAEIVAAIRQLLAQSGTQMAYAYRNLELATDDDLASLLADLEYLASKRLGESDK